MGIGAALDIGVQQTSMSAVMYGAVRHSLGLHLIDLVVARYADKITMRYITVLYTDLTYIHEFSESVLRSMYCYNRSTCQYRHSIVLNGIGFTRMELLN